MPGLLGLLVPRKDIGWEEIGEQFTRYTLWSTRWFNIYLHKLNSPQPHAECHDHPWNFIAILLWRGYFEEVNGQVSRRWPGSILWRPAEFAHNVTTKGTSYSVIITGPKRREWGFKACQA